MPAEIRFSVVIPAWNAAATIVDTVRSCLAQTTTPYEVIIVDNGSTDGTDTLVSGIFGSKIHLIALSSNNGPSAARNVGIEASRGTHIAFLDADDQWHPEKLSLLAQAWAIHPDASLIYHYYTTNRTLFSKSPDKTVPTKQLLANRLLLGNVIATPTATVNRNASQRFDEQMQYCEDYDYFLQLAEKGPVFCLPLPLTVLGRPILAPGGQSAARWAMRLGERRVWEKWAARAKGRALFLPFLTVWGWLKHIRSGLLR